jgi:hypothetical protein
MRSFSSLRENCVHDSLLKNLTKNYARDKAAGKGTLFHSYIEKAVLGVTFFGEHDEDVKVWVQRLFSCWEIPSGCMSEVAIGLDAAGKAHEVDEPEPHCYVAKDPSVEIITAGRLDLRWHEDDGKTLVVVDLKTGQSYLGDPWSIPQLVAQAVAALAMEWRGDSKVERVKLGVYYARLGIFDYGSGPQNAAQVADRFKDVSRWALMTNEPRPGAHCLSCYEKKSCAAFEEMTAA